MHSVYLVSWSNVSNKPLKTIILTFNTTFSFLVVWLGSEILIFRKDYHRNNDVYCLMLLERSYNIFRLSSNSAWSTSVILANSSCCSFALGQGLSFLQRCSFHPDLERNIWIESLHIFNVLDKLTPFMLGALKRARPVSQSVKTFKMSGKNILSGIRTCHPPSGSSNQEVWGGGNPTATPTLPTLNPTPYLSRFSKGSYSLLGFLFPSTGWMTSDCFLRHARPLLIRPWSWCVVSDWSE